MLIRTLALVFWTGAALAAAPGNLLDGTVWSSWSQRPELAPQFSQERQGPMLRMTSRGYPSYGKWIALVRGIQAGKYYRFEAPYRAEGIPSVESSVAAIISWCGDEEGKRPVQRDYLLPGQGGLERVLAAPAGARVARIELVLRWADAGSVAWRAPGMFETAAPPVRKVRVVTTHIKPPQSTTIEANLKLMCDMLDRTAELKPDLVLFSENMAQENVRLPREQRAQTIPGRITETLAERARRYRTNIVTTMTERVGELYYNTAIIIDRQGRIIGKFRKVHLPMVEGEGGITPGREYPVFNTDFGRVGIMTCWDNWFPESARALRMNGAEILLHPVEADLEQQHWEVIPRARAIDNGVYFISASLLGKSPSQIVDPQGRVLAETAEPFAYIWQDIDLDATSRVRFLSVGAADGEPKTLYIRERRPDTYSPITGKR